MPSCRIVLSSLFMDDVRQAKSAALAQHSRKLLAALSTFPDMGRVAQSPTLISRFGEGVRTLVCGNYLLVYLHEDDVVKALALYPARMIR